MLADSISPLTYTVTCNCGEVISITSAKAGGVAICVCGQSVPVPKLSQLRVAAGGVAHPVSATERIAGMLARNELPDRDRCMICNIKTDDIVWCAIIIELQRTSRSDERTFLYFLLFGWIVILIAAIRPNKTKTYGNDLTLDVPLRLCRNCLPSFESTKSQSKIHDMMRRVPACNDLLDAHPNAKVYPNCRG